MKISLISTYVSMSLLFSCSVPGLCQESPQTQSSVAPILSDLVVLIKTSLQSNEKITSCGTGLMIGPSRLLTAWHVVKSVCSEKSCNGISLTQPIPDQPGSFRTLKLDRVSIPWLFAGLDVVILELSSPLDIPSPISFTTLVASTPPSEQEVLTQIGYPHCSEREELQGSVLSEDPLYIDTSIQGAPGSSGSPLFDSSGKLAAISVQATSALSALRGRLTGTPFAMRAIHAGVISRLLMVSSSNQALFMQAEILNQYYRERVIPTTGISRIVESLKFLGRVEELTWHGLRTAEKSQKFIFENISDTPFDISPGFSFGNSPEEQKEIEELLLLDAAYHVERSGVSDVQPQLRALETRISPLQNQSLLTRLEDFQTKLNQYHFWGIETVSAILFWCGLGLFGSWIVSVWWVWRTTQGQIFSRLAKTAFVNVVLWPISLLAFAILRKR